MSRITLFAKCVATPYFVNKLGFDTHCYLLHNVVCHKYSAVPSSYQKLSHSFLVNWFRTNKAAWILIKHLLSKYDNFEIETWLLCTYFIDLFHAYVTNIRKSYLFLTLSHFCFVAKCLKLPTLLFPLRYIFSILVEYCHLTLKVITYVHFIGEAVWKKRKLSRPPFNCFV
jgi:hypothetical protein